MLEILVINGPNLNLLGVREPKLYGATSYKSLCASLITHGIDLGYKVTCEQSNHEGAIIDLLQNARGKKAGVIINPAGYTHSSVSIRDALLIFDGPAIEVHLTQVASRESFRQVNLISDVVLGTVSGFGVYGYQLALLALHNHIQKRN